VGIGLSRQFAFAQFAALENARAFLDRYYPSIQLYGVYDPTQTENGEGAIVRISYSREREERDRAGKNEDDWKCEVVCFTHDLKGIQLTNVVLHSELFLPSCVLPL